jgi:3-oxoacyl-[acyl-carrier-protein] synthase III
VLEPVSILDFGSYLPGSAIGADFFLDEEARARPLADSPLFRPPALRHHVARDERAAEMIERAARPMLDRLDLGANRELDIIITNVLLPDIPITGAGAEVAQRIDCSPDWIIDLHNGGCASFAYMLKLASAIIGSGSARSALLCNVQNAAGQVYMQSELRKLAGSALPGDGCGVAYLRTGEESPVLAVETHNDPRCALDMDMAFSDGRKYWEPGTSQMSARFDPAKSQAIVERGNRLIPELVSRLCERIGVSPHDIDVLVTNQPNRLFLRNWRKTLDIEPERHLDTFDRFGNLYGAGVPVTLDWAVRAGKIRHGDLVVLAGFAHAGDFAAAAALRWRANAPAASPIPT